MVKELRLHTAKLHAALDALVSFNAQSLNESFLTRLLKAHARIIFSWEKLVIPNFFSTFTELLKEREKSILLEQSLATLNGTIPSLVPLPSNFLTNPSYFLGGVYVVEGSTLGGTTIAKLFDRKVPAEALNYFLSYRESTSTKWRECLTFLENYLKPETVPTAVCGAEAMFNCFYCAFQLEGFGPDF